MSLERFCRKPVVTVEPEQSVYDAVLKMLKHHVGAVVVVDDDRPVGLVTDRDLVLRVILEKRAPEATPVRDVMSRNIAVIQRDEKIDAAVSAIRNAGVRRLPIVDANGTVVGIVTLDDLFVLVAGELSAAAAAIRGNRDVY